MWGGGPLEVCCHLGGHCAEGPKLQNSLLKNRFIQQKRGILILEPKTYQKQLNTLSRNRNFIDFNPDLNLGLQAETEIADASPTKLVLTSERYFGLLRKTLLKGCFYSNAVESIRNLTALFPDSEISIHFIIRNPATFIPALLQRSTKSDLLDLTDGTNPLEYRWSELFQRISMQFPKINFTVCCYEDLPLLWGEFIRDMISVPIDQKIKGAFDLIDQCMTQEGMTRLRQYFKLHPNFNELQKRRVISAFFEKFAIDDMLFEEVTIHGWDQNLLDLLSEIYEDDIVSISKIPNVTLLSM